MKYLAEVLEFSNDVEEEVTLFIQQQRLVCFASYCPHPIYISHRYSVEVLPMVFNNYHITTVDNHIDDGLKRIGNTFAYEITGLLNYGKIIVNGLELYDEFLHSDYSYLNNRKVCWIVDRIDVDFSDELYLTRYVR